MVQTITPFRISFMGGRSDFPSFYKKEEGFVVSASIDKFLEIKLTKENTHQYWLEYSKEELVSKIEDIEHSLIREAFKAFPKTKKWGGLRLQVKSDIPSGTGLGSSSAMSVGLMNALQTLNHEKWSKVKLAEKASLLEIDKLQSFIGKQDQYCAAFGGFNKYRFLTNGEVIVEPVQSPIIRKLEESLCIFFTGIQRDGAKILEKERKDLNFAKICNMRDLAKDFAKELEDGSSLSRLGDILDKGWLLKESLQDGISTPEISAWYKKGLEAGAYGGKLLGAGGGGYLMFLCEPSKQMDLEKNLSELKRLPISFYESGSEVVKEVSDEEVW